MHRGKTSFARKVSYSEGESRPHMGLLFLVIELIPLDLTNASPEGTVQDHVSRGF